MPTPQVLKRMLTSSAFQWAVSAIVASYANFVRMTARIRTAAGRQPDQVDLNMRAALHRTGDAKLS